MEQKEKSKERHLATCQNCGEITDISMSKSINKFIVHNKTLREEITMANKERIKLRSIKNGQIQTMHKMIKRLYDLMTPEQRKQAYEYSKQLRDELKGIEKKYEKQ